MSCDRWPPGWDKNGDYTTGNLKFGILDRSHIQFWIPELNGELTKRTVTDEDLSQALVIIGDLSRCEKDPAKKDSLNKSIELIAISISKSGLIK